MFFSDWASIGRTIIVGALAYGTLVVVLRISGKRTLSKMNAFDLVVTVALGSTLATILLSKDVALAEGVAAFLTLILLQWVVAWTSVRVPWFRRLVKSEPTLLFYQGTFLREALRRQRVVESEVQAAIRAEGIRDPAQVAAVVLETDGTFTVVRAEHGPAGQADSSALQEVQGYPPKEDT